MLIPPTKAIRVETHRTHPRPSASSQVMTFQSVNLYTLFHPQVNNEGFFAVEDGDLRTQRVLLSDVSTEAARAFLHYLYTADTSLPPQLTPDLSSLACRSALFFHLLHGFDIN